MDTGKIKQLVDGYIEELRSEFARYAQEMVTSGEGAQEEIDDIGLLEDLFMDLWDPQEILRVSKTACSLYTEHIFQILDGMDPEEELEARKMIHQKLRDLHDELSSAQGGDDDAPDDSDLEDSL